MKKLRKKILCTLLAVAMAFSMLPVNGFAETHIEATNRWASCAKMPDGSSYGPEDAFLEVGGKLYISENAYRTNIESNPQRFLIYSIIRDSWSRSAPSPYARGTGYTTFVSYQDKIYCFGATYDIYDTSTDSWIEGGTLESDYEYEESVLFSSTFYQGKIYLFHRYTRSNVSNCSTLHIYDIATNTMSDGGLMPEDLNVSLEPILYQGKIYTRVSGPLSKNYFLIYDIATGDWGERGESSAHFGYDSTVVQKENILYIFKSEYENGRSVGKFIIYDIDTDYWKESSALDADTYGFTSTLNGSQIYVIGKDKCYVYDIETDTWAIGSDLHSQKNNNKTLNYYGIIYTVGDGVYNGETTPHSLESYIPGLMITSVPELEGFSVAYGSSAEEIKSQLDSKRPLAEVVLSDGTTTELPVVWDTGLFNMGNTVVAIAGFDLSGRPEIATPVGYPVKIEVTVNPEYNPKEIVSLETERKSIKQNIELWPTEKENEFGTPSTAELPETVEATLRDGSSVQVPVTWQVEGYDPTAVGKQSFTGKLVLGEDSGIENPDNLQAELEITVTAAEYEVWDASPLEIAVEVLPGTTVAELNEKLKAEGKTELSVDAVDMSTEDHVYTFCDIEVKEGNNAQWTSQMDVPGEYRLTASLPENFTPLDVDIPGPVEIKVTVTEPLEIISVEPVNMEAYQSVSPGNLENVPKQVMATLEGGMEIPIDVLWNWEGSGYQKNAVGSQIVSGELVNLPSRAKQPEQELPGTLNVDVQAVSYEVKSVSSDNLFEADAGLTLEEITQIAAPKLTLEITSVTEGITLTTEYEAEVSLEEEKNPEYNAKAADVYILEGTLTLPENITCPEGQALEEIILQTNPVEVTSIEPVNVLVPEGTPFAEIELPGTVLATLSSKGIDGENKKERLEVDWGAGEGYTPYPSELTDDNTVTMEVTSGELVNCQAYVNTAGVVAPLNVTVAREFEIEAISPSRYPETGEMEVKLGSGLEEISNGLDSHNVQVTLKSTKGETSTVEMSFELREEENPSYDPMELGTYTLKAYLPLEGNIRNPKGLGVEIVVKTKKYTIATTKAVRVTGVESGTKFEDVPMPELAPITRNDGEVEEIPVSWDGSRYNPTKIGSQVVKGTLVTPLPVHLENPNNRQPSAVVTVVNPEVKVVSLEPMKEVAKAQLRSRNVEEGVPGYTEYKYRAELLHKDGSTTYEVISVFVENK